MTEERYTNPYPLRLPADLKQWIKERASRNDRSFNSEVIHMIRQMRDSAKLGVCHES